MSGRVRSRARWGRHRRPFVRLSRAELEGMVAALEEQRDRALGEARATREWAASWLAGRAASYTADADHLDRLDAAPRPADPSMPARQFTASQRRAIGDELRQCAVDLDGARP